METKSNSNHKLDPTDPVASAVEAGLRYSQDSSPGIRRVRKGKGFRYLAPDGKPLRYPATLTRIRALAIPPAWTGVWICPDPRGHLQATGRDDRGRKQYRYHPRWRQTRDESKFTRLIAFGHALPRIRARIRRDLRRPGLPRDKVLATVVRLLDATLIRVGNEEYARRNGSYGLTTLRNRHARVRKDEIHFDFRGKSGVHHQVTIRDPRLARIIRHCHEIPGQELFQYVDEAGEIRPIESEDVNEYLRSAAGEEYSAKDFRTWAATVLAAEALRDAEPPTSKAASKRNIVRAVESVARRLGNTVAVCRNCYIHPAILAAYESGALQDRLKKLATNGDGRPTRQLRRAEAAVLRFLRRRGDRS